jgi:hypothetical protein
VKSASKKKNDLQKKREQYFAEWRERFRAWKGAVGRDEIAAATGLSAATISGLTSDREDLKMPDPFAQKAIAELMNASPAWLAFGLGPRDSQAARRAFELAEDFAALPGLADVADAYRKASPADRDMLLYVARRQVASMITKADTAPLPPKNEKPVNRRDELRVVHVTLEPRGDRLPTWINLAAGRGRDLEISDEFIHVRELPDWRNVHSLVVSGESMLETLRPGDIVLLRRLENVEMVSLSKNADIRDDFRVKPMADWKRIVPHDSICVLSINSGEPTLKRIKYVGTEAQWFMNIVADNPNEWPESPKTIMPTDEVKFHGILYAIGDGRFSNSRIEYYKDLKK